MPKIVGVIFISGIHLWLRKPINGFIEMFNEMNFNKHFRRFYQLLLSIIPKIEEYFIDI